MDCIIYFILKTTLRNDTSIFIVTIGLIYDRKMCAVLKFIVIMMWLRLNKIVVYWNRIEVRFNFQPK